jgi:Tfp pilus assembly protein PilF
MYQLALKLCPKESALFHTLSVDGNYFAGLVQRLRFPTVPDHSKMLDSAFKYQYAALGFEPYQAAYLHNELGNLFVEKGLFDSALHHFTMASNISPTWAIPWVNLIGLQNIKGNLAAARKAAAQAKLLQPGLDTAAILMENEGITEELSKNWLRAEELQTRSIAQNKIHYFPYERLGYVYTNTARYGLADSLFNEADIRKNGFYFHLLDLPTIPVQADISVQAPNPCFVPVIADTVKDAYQLLIAANNVLFYKRDTVSAAHFFKTALLITDTLFLLNHYYGKLLYAKGRMIEAEQFLKKASVQFIDKEIFANIVPSLKKHVPVGMKETCFDNLLLQMQYDAFEDYYLLADIYEKFGQYENAENCYRFIMAEDKRKLGRQPNDTYNQFAISYQLLAAMLIKTKHYEKAEKVWLDYLDFVLDGQERNFQLEQFYEMMLGLFPQSAVWHNKASAYWYKKITSHPAEYIYDEKKEMENDGLPLFQLNKPSYQYYDLGEMPGVGKNLNFAKPVPHPFKKTLEVLQQTLEMAKTDEELDLINLNVMLGDLYRLAGKKMIAAGYYATAIGLAKNDASLRSKLAANYLEGHFYTDAYLQLDTLVAENRLFTNHYLQYAAMAMHKGDYKKAMAMLANCKAQLLQQQDSVAELFARLYFVQGNAVKAIPYYKDSIKQAMPIGDRYYAIACMEALGKNKKVAFGWLEKALKNGFMYGLVLQNDPAWVKYKTDKDWLALVNAYQYKKYLARDVNDKWKVE